MSEPLRHLPGVSEARIDSNYRAVSGSVATVESATATGTAAYGVSTRTRICRVTNSPERDPSGLRGNTATSNACTRGVRDGQPEPQPARSSIVARFREVLDLVEQAFCAC